VRDGKLICVGSISQVMSECAAGEAHPDTVNLREKFVMPGFNDAHVHLGWAGEACSRYVSMALRSIEELKTRLAAGVAAHKPANGLLALVGITRCARQAIPNRWELDDVSRKIPSCWTHVSGHVAIANSMALKLAELDRNSPNPQAANSNTTASGELTGMLKEGPAMERVRMPFRKPPPSSAARNPPGARRSRQKMESLRRKIIRVGRFPRLQAVKEDGKLTVRITEWLHFTEPVNDLQKQTPPKVAPPTRGSKAGAPQIRHRRRSRFAHRSHARALFRRRQGHRHSDHGADKLRAMAIERDKAGFQLNFHAIWRSRQPHHPRCLRSRRPKPMASAIAATASNTHKSSLPTIFRVLQAQRHRFHAALPSNHRHAAG